MMIRGRGVGILAWGVFAITVLFFALVRPLGAQWDFAVYYRSALAFLNHTNPYQAAPIPGHEGLGLAHYTYPPLTLLLFAPMTLLPLGAASGAWIALKCGILFFLVRKVNRKLFKSSGLTFAHGAFLVFGFNSTILSDLVTGNTTLIQMLPLWLGLLSYRERGYHRAAIYFVIASLLKGLPILFLLLLLRERASWRAFGLGCGLFAAYLGANALVFPEYSRFFLSEALQRGASESGILAPSLLAFWQDGVRSLGTMGGVGLSVPGLDRMLYLLSAAVIFVISLRQGVRRQDSSGLILFSTLAYLLVLPRVKSYDLMIALPAAFAVIEKQAQKWRPLLYVGLSLPLVFSNLSADLDITSSVLIGPFKKLFALSYLYQPLIGIFVLWLLSLREQRQSLDPSFNYSQDLSR